MNTRYYLTSFYNNEIRQTQSYLGALSEIRNNGLIVWNVNGVKVDVFTPELYEIFSSTELLVKNMDTNENVVINGKEYLTTYVQAFNEGKKYFESNFKISADTLYGQNAAIYVRDIHLNYFHTVHNPSYGEGWVFVKKSYAIILTHSAIKEYGFYSGIVSSVDEQVKKYAKLFENFDKCEHSTPVTTIEKQETKADRLKVELTKYGFFELPKVQALSELNQNKLIELLGSKGMPYSMAMFKHLEYITYLNRVHFNTSKNRDKEIANWFGKAQRTIKGNILVLNSKSTEDRSRYTSDQFIEIVKTDYEKLK